jgi:ABC-2 type transport system ATP-binding protein
MTVAGFLNFVAQIKGVSAGERQQRVKISIDRCGLEDKSQVLIRKLSKGYKQRVGIAQAIIHDPPVIILDEPTVGLDPRQINEVRQLIKSLAGSHTIILSTHILPEVSMTCDRITIINRGQIVVTDTPANLTARLVGEGIYEVEVQGNVDQAQALLKDLAQVQEIVRLETNPLPPDHHRLRVRGDGNATLGQEIAATLVNGGLGLHELRRQQASLEEVFLNLTTVEGVESTPSTGEYSSPA